MDQPSDRAGRFFARIIAHPYRVVGAFAVLTVLAAWQLPRVRMDTDLRAYLPHDETYLDDHRIRETYDVRDTLIAAIVREPTALDVPTLRYARAVAARIEELDGVHRVSSLLSEDNIENTPEGLEIAPFIEEVTEASVAALRRKIAGFPAIHGIFVSQDGTCIALIVEVQGDADRGRIYHEIERISEEEESPEGTQVYLAGMPVCEGVLGEYMMRDLAVMMPAVIVVVVLLLFAAYRSWLLIVVALVEVALVDIWVIGLMAFAGVRLHTVHGTMPVVLMALAVADEIHIFDDYFARRLRGAAARQFRQLLHAAVPQLRPVYGIRRHLGDGLFAAGDAGGACLVAVEGRRPGAAVFGCRLAGRIRGVGLPAPPAAAGHCGHCGAGGRRRGLARLRAG